MILTADNYFSEEADKFYMSASQYKSFCGSAGMRGCEAKAMAKLRKEWEDEETTAMLVSSYVDAFYSGELDIFKRSHPQIFTQKGELKADYKQADRIIERSLQDKLFQGFMAGEKQAIMQGHFAGAEWKIKMDSYLEGKAIVDLKVMQAIFEDDREEIKSTWVRDLGYIPFTHYWGYDIQGAIYQEVVYQNTGKRLPFFIAALDKQKETGMAIFHLDDQVLKEALIEVEKNMPRILDLKAEMEEPDRCECCDYCRHTKVLTEVMEIGAGYAGKD